MLKKCLSYKNLLLRVEIFLILLSTSIVQAERSKLILSVEDVNALIPEIEAVERRLINLKVESEAWVETKADLSDPCELWQRTTIYVASTAWFDGRPKGKARIDVHKQVTKWIDGAAPYAERSYSLGFDGHYGRVVNHTTGHSGKTFPSKKGERLPHAPKQLRAKWLGTCTGWQFSNIFFFNDEEEDMSFSRFFRTAISPAALEAKAFEVALEEFEGVECIIFGTGEKKWGHISYWLDPSRGFALLGHDNISIREDSSEWVSTRIRVNKLKEVTPGIWWPMEAYVESDPLNPGEPYTRTVYRASNVVANDPNFDENIFTVPFPEGYLIDDQVVGRKYKVGQE